MGFLINSAFAFIGGVVLNFMPCVFPFLHLKAAAIINGPSNSFKLKLNGIAYTLGVLISMLILSLTLLTLRNSVFHMQSPVLVLALLYIMFAIGLCFFCGSSEITLVFSCSNKASSSFFCGMFVMLGIVPCITPFMAPAIGFALTQPSIFIFVGVFLSLSLGISLPHLIISFFPNTLEFLPKPGKWTEVLKHFLFFHVSLAVIWLFWALIKGSNTVPGFLSLAFSIWTWIFNNDIKQPIKPVISILFLRLIYYHASYPRQHKKPFFKGIYKSKR